MNCASDRLAISSSLSCIFSGALKCSVIWAIWAIFFLSWCICYFKGWSLRCSLGWGNAGCCAVILYVGEGLRGSNGACSTPCWTRHSLRHPQSNWAPLVLVPEWVGLCTPQAPVVSPRTSPVRLGVSPAAAPTPTGVFNQRFDALFPRAGALGCGVCLAPRRLSGLSVRECGAAGSASGQTACPVGPTLRQSQSRQGNTSPLHPGCLSPPLLPVWMNVHFLFPWCRTSLPFDFLSVLVV